MLIGLIVYRSLATTYLQDKGLHPKAKLSGGSDSRQPAHPLTWVLVAALVLFVLIMQFSGNFAWDSKKSVATSMGIIAIVIVIVYFLNLIFASHLRRDEVRRVCLLFILFWGAVLFWAGFEQQGSSLQIFADRYSALPFNMPSSWFQNFNPLFILIFASLVGGLWVFLESRRLNPPALVKFAAGLFLLALGYYIMVWGARVALTGVKASSLFLISTYLFHTLGELCLSPVGLSTYTKLAPKKYLSQLMGVWFVAAALGNLFAGLFAGGFHEENIEQMPAMFMSIVWFCLVVGGIILLLQRPVRHWTGGIR